ncbi:MAG: DUF4912 domain-containing protein [Planctomycetota bacterium]
MNSIPEEKYHVEPEVTAVGHTKVETHSEPDRDAIYLDYGPLLPDSYNQNIIVLLIRDPECVFCYWELSGTAVTAALGNKREPNLKWILRVQNISQKSFNDIAIPTPQNYSGIQGNYYLTVLPDTKYQSEFGVRTADNRFISLVKSNIITTPRRNKAPITDTTSYIR